MGVLFAAFTLSGCSWQGSFLDNGRGPAIIQAPPGQHIAAVTPNAIIEEADPSPTDTVKRALGQTQRIRTYVRQLAR